MNHEEKYILQKAMSSHFHNVNFEDIIIDLDSHLQNGYAKVRVFPNIHSESFFSPTKVTYEKFKLADYKTKITDLFLVVPVNRAQSPQALVNYMNEIYINSVVVRQRFLDYPIFRSFQVSLTLANLDPFELMPPSPGDVLLIKAKDESCLFNGILRIKFE